MHIAHWFELLYKIPLILYYEHLQHFTKELSSSYFMSLPKSRPRSIKKQQLDSTLIIAWPCLVRSLNEGSFFSCQKLSSQVYLALVTYFLKNIYSYPFHNEMFQKKPKQRGLRKYFFENPMEFFHFFTILLEIPDKRKLNAWIIHKIALDPLEKTTTLGIFTFFLGHPWKFHFVIN